MRKVFASGSAQLASSNYARQLAHIIYNFVNNNVVKYLDIRCPLHDALVDYNYCNVNAFYCSGNPVTTIVALQERRATGT